MLKKEEMIWGLVPDFISLQNALDKLCKTHLIFDESGFLPEQAIHGNRFLCAKISDTDMPWDHDAVDW